MNKINKKNKISKKKVWTTIASILLATASITLVTITIISLTSYNNDKRDVENAKEALEKLTITQKTVDSTKITNQKLPSEISSKITSMETLHNLIKGVIIVPNGVTYTPQVFDTNDIKGELVVEITIKKGAVTDTFKFIVTGFKEIITQADKDDWIVIKDYQKLIKKTTEAITTEKTLLASNVKYASVNEFNSKTNVTLALPPKDVKVKISVNDYLPTWVHVDKNGRQFVNFEITKGAMTARHTIIVDGFRQWLKIDEDAIKDYKKLIGKITKTTIKNKLLVASEVEYASVYSFNFKTNATLALPPKDIEVKITVYDNNPRININGKQNVIFKITKGDAVTNHVIAVTGFKKIITQADKDDWIAIKDYQKLIMKLTKTTINKKDSVASKVEYASVADFNAKTNVTLALPPKGIKVKIAVILYSDKKPYGEQIVYFRITKGIQIITTSMTIDGFKGLY